MDDSVYSLRCLIRGRAWPLKISLSKESEVNDLKSQIWERSFAGTNAHAESLQLFKVLSTADFLWLTLSQLNDYEPIPPDKTLIDRINDQIKSGGHQLSNIALLLDKGTDELADLFEEPPPKKHLHILVNCEWNLSAFLLRDC
jgi:hypothetical protein